MLSIKLTRCQQHIKNSTAVVKLTVTDTRSIDNIQIKVIPTNEMFSETKDFNSLF